MGTGPRPVVRSGWRSAAQPTRTGTKAPTATPTIAPRESRHRSSPAAPKAMRPRPVVSRCRPGKPASLALQDAALPAHHGDRQGGDREERRRQPGVEAQGQGDGRYGGQADDREHHGRAVARREDLRLDPVEVAGRGRDPPCAGGLQPEREHADHHQQPHDGGEGAVLTGPEEARGQDREPVGGDVHHAHGDRDDPAARAARTASVGGPARAARGSPSRGGCHRRPYADAEVLGSGRSAAGGLVVDGADRWTTRSVFLPVVRFSLPIGRYSASKSWPRRYKRAGNFTWESLRRHLGGRASMRKNVLVGLVLTVAAVVVVW